MKNTFLVCDHRIAYKLMKEGFECVKIKPSNKAPDECRFVFYFVSSDTFKERFNAILKAEIAENLQKNEQNCEKSTEKCSENAEKGDTNADYKHIVNMLDKIFDRVTALNFAVASRSSDKDKG